jgi:hypothetical protein
MAVARRCAAEAACRTCAAPRSAPAPHLTLHSVPQRRALSSSPAACAAGKRPPKGKDGSPAPAAAAAAAAIGQAGGAAGSPAPGAAAAAAGAAAAEGASGSPAPVVPYEVSEPSSLPAAVSEALAKGLPLRGLVATVLFGFTDEAVLLLAEALPDAEACR